MDHRLDLMYRALNRPVDHQALLDYLISEVNAVWFDGEHAGDEMTMSVVRRCHQILWDQRDKPEQETVVNLIKIARTWDRQSKELRDSPAKHLLRWNAALIQSALLDAFT